MKYITLILQDKMCLNIINQTFRTVNNSNYNSLKI